MNNNIIIIILLIVLVIILCVAIHQQNQRNKSLVQSNEPFSFWSDLEDFFTDWGKEIICAAANDCNACGEDGTSPCSSCSSNSSVADCMNANSQFNTSTWCRHYFNQSDNRHNVPCPDITGKNAVNNSSTPENTNWIIANNRVIQIINNQYKCLALKSAPNVCMDWIEYQKQMPSSTVCDSL